MKTEHTPGPWMARTGTANTAVYAGAYAVAVGCKAPDAHLIAAAPDLLTALESLLTESMVDVREQRDMAARQVQARAAILKAKGGKP